MSRDCASLQLIGAQDPARFGIFAANVTFMRLY